MYLSQPYMEQLENILGLGFEGRGVSEFVEPQEVERGDGVARGFSTVLNITRIGEGRVLLREELQGLLKGGCRPVLNIARIVQGRVQTRPKYCQGSKLKTYIFIIHALLYEWKFMHFILF